MAYFRVSASNLTQFIRNYHSDMIGTPEWGDGTSTSVPSHEFWRVAEDVWGVTSGEGYMHNEDAFDFRITDAARFKQLGLARYGKVYS